MAWLVVTSVECLGYLGSKLKDSSHAIRRTFESFDRFSIHIPPKVKNSGHFAPFCRISDSLNKFIESRTGQWVKEKKEMKQPAKNFLTSIAFCRQRRFCTPEREGWFRVKKSVSGKPGLPCYLRTGNASPSFHHGFFQHLLAQTGAFFAMVCMIRRSVF